MLMLLQWITLFLAFAQIHSLSPTTLAAGATGMVAILNGVAKPQDQLEVGLRPFLTQESRSEFNSLRPISSIPSTDDNNMLVEDVLAQMMNTPINRRVSLTRYLRRYLDEDKSNPDMNQASQTPHLVTHELFDENRDSENFVPRNVLKKHIDWIMSQKSAADSIQLDLTDRLQSMMNTLGEQVQKETSMKVGQFVGKRLQNFGVYVAARIIEAQYVSGIGAIAAEASRSLISDNVIEYNFLADSIIRKSNEIVSNFQLSLGAKLKNEWRQTDSLVGQFKLVSEGFTKDILTKGSYDHFEQLCRLRQNPSPEIQKFSKDVTQFIIFANPAVNPLLALTIIQFVCATKTFPPQVSETFSSPKIPVFLNSKMNSLGESAKRVVADSKADKILTENLVLLPDELKPPLKKWISDGHVALFDGLCAGMRSDNEHVRTLAMMTRNSIAGSSPIEAITFKAFIDSLCYSSKN